MLHINEDSKFATINSSAGIIKTTPFSCECSFFKIMMQTYHGISFTPTYNSVIKICAMPGGQNTSTYQGIGFLIHQLIYP